MLTKNFCSWLWHAKGLTLRALTGLHRHSSRLPKHCRPQVHQIVAAAGEIREWSHVWSDLYAPHLATQLHDAENWCLRGRSSCEGKVKAQTYSGHGKSSDKYVKDRKWGLACWSKKYIILKHREWSQRDDLQIYVGKSSRIKSRTVDKCTGIYCHLPLNDLKLEELYTSIGDFCKEKGRHRHGRMELDHHGGWSSYWH